MKQVIVIRKDLNMRKGKMVSQGCHASSEICMQLASLSSPWAPGLTLGELYEKHINWFRQWQTQHAHAKICVSVDSESELLDLYKKAVEAGLPCALVQDIGKTEFNGVATYTALAIGPAPSDLLDPLTGHLKLL